MASITIHSRARLLVVLAALAATIWLAGFGVRAHASSGGTAPPGASGTPARHVVRRVSARSSRVITISSARCIPAGSCGTNPHEVSTGGRLALTGRGLSSGMVVAFPRSAGARIVRNSPGAHLHATTSGLVVAVPRSAHSGRIEVLARGRRSNTFGPIHVVRHSLHPPAKNTASPPVTPSAPAAGGPFDNQGMWIWYVSDSAGGSVSAIVARAKAAGVSTLYIKSSDGSSNYWSQFSKQLVEELHAAGLKVCAWQYVYGTNPAGEANLGAEAVANGADCLVIDAEAEYEGRYGAAQTYISALRAKIGSSYPLGLASFPYVYYHTSEPYSVFLGPEGAQYNLPQMYWKAIGNSVDTVYANTFVSNRVYGRAIFPLGQTYESPSTKDVVRFREEATLYGASGISWWDFQETSSSGWAALAQPLSPLESVTPDPSFSELSQGSKGDPTLWMQEHLATAIPSQETTGIFDATTKANLEQFQTSHGIPASGHTDAATWQALLALSPVAVDWTGEGPKG